ncbi:hypothetical protein WL32_08305 [Burkholderia cepacia]|uniref:hypothetical protein n=1 Tax=Burkholderia cepacia TaxID=292 RepID=UPI00075EB387|nr:hypothetical protein [Burkholderia cepacia]KWB24973.1 hypothetical protein WL32_08305 [Burkholderia cepacia]
MRLEQRVFVARREQKEQLYVYCVHIAFYLLRQAERDQRLVTTVLASVEKEWEEEAGPALASNTPGSWMKRKKKGVFGFSG